MNRIIKFQESIKNRIIKFQEFKNRFHLKKRKKGFSFDSQL